MGDRKGHPFRGNQWAPVVGVHSMTPARLRQLKKLAKGEGDAAQQARRQIANMRLPNESAADFVQRQLADEKFLDAQALERIEKSELSARLRSDMEAEGRTATARRTANIEALLRNPSAGGVPKPVFDKDGRVVNRDEMERSARAL